MHAIWVFYFSKWLKWIYYYYHFLSKCVLKWNNIFNAPIDFKTKDKRGVTIKRFDIFDVQIKSLN